MRLYRSLIRFLRVVTHLYFIEVRSSGRDHVPREGPLILAANHPGSVLDAILLSTQVPRPIRYLARSGLFRLPLLATLFRSLGAIPVYRPHETADASERNRVTFARVHEHLELGGCIGVFPEGRNSPWAKVGQLRTGVARMALGAEARNDFALGLVIVPVGINHDRRDLLTSDALLRFGKPIRVADYRQIYQGDPEVAVQALTDEVQQVLRRQALHIADRRLERMVSDLETVFSDRLARLLDQGESLSSEEPEPTLAKRWVWKMLRWYHRSSVAAGRALEQRILSRQLISSVLSRTLEQDPKSLVALRIHLERYKDHLAQGRLKAALQQSFDHPVRERWVRLRMTVFAVVTAPVALFGLAHNVVPYLITKFLPRIFRDEAVRTFAFFGMGVLAFLSSYAAVGYWLWRSSELAWPWILAYIAVLPPTGFVALGYRRSILAYRDKILVRTFVFDQAQLVELLRSERESLFARFEALSERYRD
ncbi:1-acyl-sn-glycerol-3-phosphate acyltransferase [Wenzhouxiangella sp. 15181]|uniref:1-acyl-sn-glycerol-3-phosphate acyltransferase n=2 Tax=unclassified Wenzhouxiangella TaxID=2613841 RepID=UPI0015F29CDF|nr:1-acyl-sn-glycerol-3-phosphate acyltransferase [Wenzhouxiangella sp. 15181]